MGACINRYRHTFVPGKEPSLDKARKLALICWGDDLHYEVFPIVDGRVQWSLYYLKDTYGVDELPELGHWVTGFIVRECIQSQACPHDEGDEYAQACHDSLEDWKRMGAL